MDAELRERLFLASQESPGSWLLHALRLNAAAERLDWEKNPIRDDEPATSFIAEHQMLLGLAFENVLKGFISLIRLESGKTPPLPRECHIHKLERLAERVECQELALTVHKLASLARLSPYIEWAGRYPTPKKFTELIVISSGTHERAVTRELWNRLVPLLLERAWVMKGGPESMGGHKLYFEQNA